MLAHCAVIRPDNFKFASSGPGVANLNMTDPNQQCMSRNLNLSYTDYTTVWKEDWL